MTNKQQLIERIIDMAENDIDKDILSHYAQSIATAWLEDREKTVSKYRAAIKGIRDGISGHNFPETVAAIDGILADLTKPKDDK